MKKTIAFSLVLILLVSCLASCDFFEYNHGDSGNTTEHTHQWQDVSGEHARICVGCNEKQLKPEACDWKFVGQTSDCWSTTVIQACSKCGMEQFLHGDSVLPHHSWEEVTADGKTTFSCTRCAESITFVSEIREFDYEKILEQYKIGDPGVKHENFKNPEVEREDTSAIDAIIRATFELTIEYDTISVSQDKESNMWCVSFWTLNLDGNGQDVYINDNGLTCYIVYGE